MRRIVSFQLRAPACVALMKKPAYSLRHLTAIDFAADLYEDSRQDRKYDRDSLFKHVGYVPHLKHPTTNLFSLESGEAYPEMEVPTLRASFNKYSTPFENESTFARKPAEMDSEQDLTESTLETGSNFNVAYTLRDTLFSTSPEPEFQRSVHSRVASRSMSSMRFHVDPATEFECTLAARLFAELTPGSCDEWWSIVERDFPCFKNSPLFEPAAREEIISFFQQAIASAHSKTAEDIEKEAYPLIKKAFEEWSFFGVKHWYRLAECLEEAAIKTPTGQTHKASQKAIAVVLERVVKSMINATAQLPYAVPELLAPSLTTPTQGRVVADAGLW